LELALGASRVLRKDVEDELRSIDNPKLQRVLEPSLLTGIQLVVHDDRLRISSRDLRLNLDELPLADVRAGIGSGSALHHFADRLDACGPHQLADFAEFLVLVCVWRQHGH
jgi:hypothetical protein